MEYISNIKGDDNIVADAFSRIEIHKVPKKELQQREALKMLNTMSISNIKTANMQLNPVINKRSDVNNTIINHIFQNSANDIKNVTHVRQKPRANGVNLNKNLHTCLFCSHFQ